MPALTGVQGWVRRKAGQQAVRGEGTTAEPRPGLLLGRIASIISVKFALSQCVPGQVTLPGQVKGTDPGT